MALSSHSTTLNIENYWQGILLCRMALRLSDLREHLSAENSYITPIYTRAYSLYYCQN